MDSSCFLILKFYFVFVFLVKKWKFHVDFKKDELYALFEVIILNAFFLCLILLYVLKGIIIIQSRK